METCVVIVGGGASGRMTASRLRCARGRALENLDSITAVESCGSKYLEPAEAEVEFRNFLQHHRGG